MVFVRKPGPARAAIPDGAEAEAPLQEVIDAFGGEQALAVIDADRDTGEAYLEAHYETLLARYPDESIALHRDRVVAHSADRDEFDRLLLAYVSDAAIHPSAIELHSMDTDPPLLAVLRSGGARSTATTGSSSARSPLTRLRIDPELSRSGISGGRSMYGNEAAVYVFRDEVGQFLARARHCAHRARSGGARRSLSARPRYPRPDAVLHPGDRDHAGLVAEERGRTQ